MARSTKRAMSEKLGWKRALILSVARRAPFLTAVSLFVTCTGVGGCRKNPRDSPLVHNNAVAAASINQGRLPAPPYVLLVLPGARHGGHAGGPARHVAHGWSVGRVVRRTAAADTGGGSGSTD